MQGKVTIRSIFFMWFMMINLAECNQSEPLTALQLPDYGSSKPQCDEFSITYRNQNTSLCQIMRMDIAINDKELLTLQHHSSPALAARYCTYFQIPFDSCQCHDVTIRNLATGYDVNNCRESVKTTPKALPVNDVYDLCKAFNITRQNCSCELFGKDVCDHFKRPKVIRTLYTHDYQVIYAAIATITAFFGILGNLLVIFVSQSRGNRVYSNFNTLIKMLAVYDLTFAVFQILAVFPKFWTPKWLYGVFFCRFFNTVGYLSALLAVGVILTISIERYLKIYHPLYEVTRKRLSIVLGLNFIVSFAASLPIFIYSKLGSLQTCRVAWPRNGADAEIYNMTIFIAFFALPIIIVIVLYGKIIRHLMIKTIPNGDGQLEMFKQRNLDNRRVIQSMVSVVLIFVLFVFPKHIVMIFLDSKGWNGEYIYSDVLSVHSFFLLMYVANIPYLFHVCANPLIYSITDSRWRRDLKGLVTKYKNTGIHDNITMTTFTTMNDVVEKMDDEGLLIVEKGQGK